LYVTSHDEMEKGRSSATGKYKIRYRSQVCFLYTVDEEEAVPRERVRYLQSKTATKTQRKM
ncbi:MAG: hypothetical protein SGILL_001788, partial [Bacillariaceae sp.]